jgi:hypothetical protein
MALVEREIMKITSVENENINDELNHIDISDLTNEITQVVMDQVRTITRYEVQDVFSEISFKRRFKKLNLNVNGCYFPIVLYDKDKNGNPITNDKFALFMELVVKDIYDDNEYTICTSISDAVDVFIDRLISPKSKLVECDKEIKIVMELADVFDILSKRLRNSILK